jgi:demethylmenaquinone methyltransferase/2-methoxy-6-polyprenyl-1,4-benzoquinol methylase/phosphoethanolamine N-methyltransferase
MTELSDGKTSSGYKTEGRIIHWARVYNALFGRFLSRTHGTVVSLAAPMPGETVLDVGCGTGSLTLAVKAALGANGSVHGIDASPEMIALAQRKAEKAGLDVNFQVGFAEKLPFADRTIDLVMSQLAIHHLPGDLKLRAFKEMHRVLKTNGRGVIIDFEPPPLWRSLHGLYHGHVMMQTDVRQYEKIMEDAGFTEIEIGQTRHRILAYIRGRAAAYVR